MLLKFIFNAAFNVLRFYVDLFLEKIISESQKFTAILISKQYRTLYPRSLYNLHYLLVIFDLIHHVIRDTNDAFTTLQVVNPFRVSNLSITESL